MFRFLNKTYSNTCKNVLLKLRVSAPIQFFRCKSHYSALGLDSTASQKDIKSAYYNLSLKFHPDKNDGSPESVEKFREIAEAYEVLGNPDKKRIYDRDFYGTGNSSDFNRDGYNRSGFYYRPPRSGKDQHYNYEEHIRQHYEKFYRQKEAEQEQFRRRWQAEERERWGNYMRRPPPPPDGMQFRDFIKTRTFIYTLSLWLLLLLASILQDGDKVKINKPIYYEVKEKKPNIIYYNINQDNEKED